MLGSTRGLICMVHAACDCGWALGGECTRTSQNFWLVAESVASSSVAQHATISKFLNNVLHQAPWVAVGLAEEGHRVRLMGSHTGYERSRLIYLRVRHECAAKASWLGQPRCKAKLWIQCVSARVQVAEGLRCADCRTRRGWLVAVPFLQNSAMQVAHVRRSLRP